MCVYLCVCMVARAILILLTIFSVLSGGIPCMPLGMLCQNQNDTVQYFSRNHQNLSNDSKANKALPNRHTSYINYAIKEPSKLHFIV